MIGVENLDFRQNRGGGHPKLGKYSTNSDLAETFRITPGLRKNGIGNEKFYPLSQNLILGKKGGGTPNKAKIKPTWIWLKLSGLPHTNKRL